MNEFEKWWLDNIGRLDTDGKDIAEAAYQAGAAAMRERCAEVTTRIAGQVGFPLECCQEDYEHFNTAQDIAAAIRKLGGGVMNEYDRGYDDGFKQGLAASEFTDEYWLRCYAGQAMQGMILPLPETVTDQDLDDEYAFLAKAAVTAAKTLLEEVKKHEP